MIFRADSVERIFAGTKTQTRRVAKDVCKYRVGDNYAIQPGRGKREVGRILITGIRRERLDYLDAASLGAEGFQPDPHASDGRGAAAKEFQSAWAKLHGSYDPEQLVDVIDFVLVSKRG